MTEQVSSEQPAPGDETAPSPTASRRAVLAGAGVALSGSLAGCTSTGVLGSPGAHDGVVLEKPENYEMLAGSELQHPIHGDELPEATTYDPIAEREVSSRAFVGDRHVLATFVFTRCPGACVGLTSNLRHVQADAYEEGYADEVALLVYTFDPVYDTPERLEAYGHDHGVDYDAGNWHFLRPETEARAEAVVTDTFGVFFEELSDEQREAMEMDENMAFQHSNLILLANEDGYVERAYEGQVPDPTSVLDDVQTLRERW